MTGRWHAMGGRASDGAGQHARVRWWSHAMGLATHRCGWGRVGPGWGHVGEGEGGVRAGHGSWVGGVSSWDCVGTSVGSSAREQVARRERGWQARGWWVNGEGGQAGG